MKLLTGAINLSNSELSTKLVIILNSKIFSFFNNFDPILAIWEKMSGDEKVENAQEEPEDQVNEEEMNTEDVYESISQAMDVEFLDFFA